LPSALERFRALLGLSVPRLAVCARWHGAERARVLGARGDQTNFTESSPLKENSGTFTKDKTLEDLFTYGLNDI
jgi:hypothetical protein